MLHPRDIAPAISRLRGGTLLTFDRLTDDQLEVEALPGWSVADVYRHLADTDRRSVLGGHLLEFLPGKDLDTFEDHNDANLERLRRRDRATLRRELEEIRGELVVLRLDVEGRLDGIDDDLEVVAGAILDDHED